MKQSFPEKAYLYPNISLYLSLLPQLTPLVRTMQWGKGIETALGCMKWARAVLRQTHLPRRDRWRHRPRCHVGCLNQVAAGGDNAEQVKKGKELSGAITGLLFIVFSVTLLKIIMVILSLPGF